MPEDVSWPRWLMGALALVLATVALPMTAAEAVRAAAGRAAPRPAAICAAAWLGWLRGDLWAACAMAEAARPGADDPARRRAFRDAAERALASAPYQPRLWLSLAEGDERDPQTATPFNAVLKMAHYTAPADDVDGAAERLALALSAAGPADEELDELARSDVRALIGHDRLGPLTAVYARLGDGGRRFIERAVAATRPELLQRLGAPG